MTNSSFARNLVKGKIAETIFAEMFRESGKYTVLEFGYEKIVPELIHGGYSDKSSIVETLRRAPDLAVIDKDERHVKLVEVKFRKALNNLEILEVAQRMHATWNPSSLFVATLDGFYFDSIENAITNNGHLATLSTDHVPGIKQLQYLKILQDFER
jgi:hypothetical protein